MEEQRPNINQQNGGVCRDLIDKLTQYHQAHDYNGYLFTLIGAKRVIDESNSSFQKNIIKTIIPELNLFMESMLNEHQTEILKNIKLCILEFYCKFFNDSDMTEIYISIIKLLPKIIEKDTDEIGFKAIKVTYEYYKAFKIPEIMNVIIDEIINITMSLLRTYKATNTLQINNEEHNKSPSFGRNYLKILVELVTICHGYFYNNQKAINTRTIEILKNLICSGAEFVKQVMISVNGPEQQSVNEEILICLNKIFILLVIMKKIQPNKTIELISWEEAMTIIRIVLQNTQQRDTRKELMNYVIMSVKDVFDKQLYDERHFFMVEANYFPSGTIFTDSHINEIYKYMILFNEDMMTKLSFEEKFQYSEFLLTKINNFRLNHEIKLLVFAKITKLLDELSVIMCNNENRINPDIAKFRPRFFDFTNQLLKEIAHFYDFLSKIAHKLDRFFAKEDRRTKYDFLEKNIFDSTSSGKMDSEIINKNNLMHQIEILLSNEYEKYALPEEPRMISDILNTTEKMVFFLVRIISYEFNAQPPITAGSNALGNSNPAFNALILLPQPENVSLETKVHQKAKYLVKLFNGFFLTYEKFQKQHKHPQGGEDLSQNPESQMVDRYLLLPPLLCTTVFKMLMPKIYDLIMYNMEVCQGKNCLIAILIEKLFDLKPLQDNNNINLNLRKELYEIYLEYFSSKMFYAGNNFEEYDQKYAYSAMKMSLNITILKNLFRFIIYYPSEILVKTKIVILINCIILSRNSDYFGNYIYIIRCLFKYLSVNHTQDNDNEFVQYALGMLTYLTTIKEDYLFLKDIITEVILVFPMKFKRLIDYAHLIFPSVIESLNMGQDMINAGLHSLESWINILTQKPETVNALLHKNIKQLINLLTSHLYRNMGISLNSLKLIAKFGGKSRNYLDDKTVNFKTCPNNILVLNLIDKTSNKLLDFPVDSIIEICMKIVTRKNTSYSLKTSIETLKVCLLTFIKKEINYNYIIKAKQDIMANIAPNSQQFDSKGSFKLMQESEQIKINMIYRKSEHFLFEKILRGLIVCYSMPELEKEIKDLITFIIEYFVMAMISKDKNNKHMNIFEIDPISIFDMIFEFLFTNSLIILRNSNQACTNLAKKFVNTIIDTIYKIFNNDESVIVTLEIIDLMYMKFLNFCYTNEWSKKGVGLIVLNILITRLPKIITYKYSKWLLRALFSVTSSYSSNTKMKLKNECNDIINELIMKFLQDNEDYSKLTVDILNSTMDLDDRIHKTKESFIQMYQFLKYYMNEIIENITAASLYEISICDYSIKQIFKNKKLSHNASYVFLLSHIEMNDFLHFYQNYPQKKSTELYLDLNATPVFKKDYFIAIEQYLTFTRNTEKIPNREILVSVPTIADIDYSTIQTTLQHNISQPYQSNLSKYQSDSLYDNKFLKIITTLMKRLRLNDNNFRPMISNSKALIFCYNHSHSNVFEFIFKDFMNSHRNFDIFFSMLQNLYVALVSDLFFINDITLRLSKGLITHGFRNTYIEMVYSLGKKLDVPFSFESFDRENKISFGYDLPSYMIDEVARFHEKDFTKLSGENVCLVDSYAPEIFPFLYWKLRMIKKYLKILGLFLSDPEFERLIKENNNDSEKMLVRLYEFKQKTIKIIFSYIMRRDEEVILKMCKKVFFKILSSDDKLRTWMSQEETTKRALSSFLLSSNQNDKNKTPFKNFDPLLIIHKAIPVSKEEIDWIRKILENIKTTDNIDHYIRYLHNYLSALSLLSYAKYDNIKDWSEEIFYLFLVKEKEISKTKPGFQILNTKYKTKIIKLFTLLKQEFALNIIRRLKEQSFDISSTDFFKKLLIENKAYFIREISAKTLINEINGIILEENNADMFILRNELKFLVLICKKAPRYLIIDKDFLPKLIAFLKTLYTSIYQTNQLAKTVDIIKVEKNIFALVKLYTSSFNKSNHLFFDLFELISLSKTQNERNSIQLYSMIEFYVLVKKPKIQMILLDFIEYLEKAIKNKCLEPLLKYLIIPLIIKIVQEEKEDKQLTVFLIKTYSQYFLKLIKILEASSYTNNELMVSSEKWKLFSLLIIIYNEKFINKKEKNISFNNEDLEAIKSNFIQVSKTSYYINHKYTPNVNPYWLFNTCLIGNLTENKILNFTVDGKNLLCRNSYDDSINIFNVIYEMIFPHNQDTKFYINTIYDFFKEKTNNMQLFFIISLLVKYPDEFHNNISNVISLLYNIQQKMLQQVFSNNSSAIQRKLVIQLYGLLIYYNNIEKAKSQEPNEQSLKQDLFIWKISLKLIKSIVNVNNTEYENNDILKRALTYMKEYMSSISIGGAYPMEIGTPKNKYYFHSYICLQKLYAIYLKKDTIYDMLEFYSSLYKYFSDTQHNHRIFNDFGFIMRLIFDEQAMNELNDRDKVPTEKMNNYRVTIYQFASKHIESITQNLSKRKTKFFDEDFENQVLLSDINTISSRIHNYLKEKNEGTNERILTIFPHLEFRMWILVNKYIQSLIKSGGYKQSSIKDTWDKLMKNNEFLTRHFFEIWYCYTLFIYEILHPDKNPKLKLVLFNETIEYFKSNHTFYHNLKEISDLKQSRNDPIHCIINMMPEQRPNNVGPVQQANQFKETDLQVIQETIMIGFNYFFNSQEMMHKYSKSLFNLFVKGVSFLKNTMLQPIIEHLLSTILKLPFLPQNEANKFLFQFMNVHEYMSMKVSTNVINIAMDYIDHFISNPKNNKQDTNITNSIRLLICSSRHVNEGLRKKLFLLFEKYHGKKLIDILKWIFTTSEGELSEEYNSWIPFSVDLLLYHFKENHHLETKAPYLAKLTPLYLQEEEDNDEKMDIDEDNDDNNNEDDADQREKEKNKEQGNDSDKDKDKRKTQQDDKEDEQLGKYNMIDSNIKNKTEELMTGITTFETEPQEQTQLVSIEQINDNSIDPQNNIKTMITKHNQLISTMKAKHLLPPTRDIFLIETTLSQKIWYTLFPQLWKILSKEERDILTIYINEYLCKLTMSPKCYSNIKGMIETFANCYPIIKIAPELMLSLTKSQNSWTSSYFYLENLLVTNIEKERSYNCLIKILDTLQEDQLIYGLHQYMTDSDYTKNAISNLQCANYFKVELIVNDAMRNYKDFIDNKIDIDLDENTTSINEFVNRTDFTIWQSSLITAYKNNNKWNEVISLSKEINNSDMIIDSLWNSGRENWIEVEKMLMNDTQYPAQINQIYSMMTKKLHAQENNAYQQKCMNCIKQIFQEFIAYPQNLENLDYHYFLFFQLIVEGWESTNTLKEMEKNIETNNKPSDFRENLITWRDRLPHLSEGFQSLKSLLEPRNFLFDYLRKLMDSHRNITPHPDESITQISNISDKIWNDLMYIKYARKLKLYETFFEYSDLFNNDIGNLDHIFHNLIFEKNIEEIKFVRQVTHNYHKGIELVAKYMNDIQLSNNPNQLEFEKEVRSFYDRQNAYFNYKLGNVAYANDLFNKASLINMTDYHIYNDWAEMCENVVLALKGDEKYETVWFENTIINYMMVIVYKLNKARFVIPRLLSLIKLFPKQQMNEKFNIHLSNIPSWVWIFWLPNIFDNYKQSYGTNQYEFFFRILKIVTENHYQTIYYPLMIHLKEKNDTAVHYEPLLQIAKEKDEHDNFIGKIDMMMQEIEAKLDRNKDEILLGQLNRIIEIQLAVNVKEALTKLTKYLNFLQKSNTSGYPFITKFIKDLTEVIQTRGVTIFSLFDKLKHFRYYLHSKLTTENNYNELKHVLDSKLYNEDFKGVDIPGLYSNKMTEPTKENRISIAKFESEYSYKFLNFLNQKLLIRGSNDKVFNFSLSKENITENSDIKILQMQTLLNEIFVSHKDAYKLKVKFNLPIVYFLNNKIKITQEDPNQYYMNEIFEYCMQKNGYDPEIAYTIYEEEAKRSGNTSTNQNYLMPDITEKVYNKMTQIIPSTNLKSFIHKFIISSDEILVFRKQFASSYGTNSFLTYLFSEFVALNKISLNKETGSSTFHDFKLRWVDDMAIVEKKRDIEMRFSKNISHFLSPSCLYGIIPSVIHAATRAIVDKQPIFEKILFCLFTTNRNEPSTLENRNNVIEKFMKKINFLRNTIDDAGYDNSNPLKVIIEMINKSMNEENLKKMAIYWDSWF